MSRLAMYDPNFSAWIAVHDRSFCHFEAANDRFEAACPAITFRTQSNREGSRMRSSTRLQALNGTQTRRQDVRDDANETAEQTLRRLQLNCRGHKASMERLKRELERGHKAMHALISRRHRLETRNETARDAGSEPEFVEAVEGLLSQCRLETISHWLELTELRVQFEAAQFDLQRDRIAMRALRHSLAQAEAGEW